MSCSYPIGKASVDAYRLTSVGFFTMLRWLTWLLCPGSRLPSPVEGIGVSDMADVPCDDTGYYVMLLCAAWGLDPGGRSGIPGSCESY